MLEIIEKLQEVVSKYLLPPNGPGYSVSIELDGKSILKHYSGCANLDYDIPINSKTVFSVASLAKQFTACCIAVLACENRINLDNSVRLYLPKLNDYAENITVRHLLTMTAGCREIYCLKHMQSNSLLGEMELFYRQKQPAHDAGNFYGYSNTCYTLLGHIVESISGMSEHEFAKQKIFDPLGMTNTHIHQDPEIIIKNCATSYKQIEDGSYKICDYRQKPCMGDDGLWTTTEDLVLWHNCLINKNLPSTTAELFDLIFSPFTLNNGELNPYGFGFFYDKESRDIIWQHGDSAGWQSIMRVYLKKKLSIIVMSNFQQAKHIELAIELENTIINTLFNLPRLPNQNVYESWDIGNNGDLKIRSVQHPAFQEAQEQNLILENNWNRYLGRYYCYELDTCFDIIPDGNRINIKYADKDDSSYINLLDFSDANRLMIHTHGDWGGDFLPIEFYGDEHTINFFVLQEGYGHFYFVRCTYNRIADLTANSLHLAE